MNHIEPQEGALEAAVLAWNDAVEAFLAEVNRVSAGGPVDNVASDRLRSAVEQARMRCEALAPRKAERHS